jgi:hypothetical protein
MIKFDEGEDEIQGWPLLNISQMGHRLAFPLFSRETKKQAERVENKDAGVSFWGPLGSAFQLRRSPSLGGMECDLIALAKKRKIGRRKIIMVGRGEFKVRVVDCA